MKSKKKSMLLTKRIEVHNLVLENQLAIVYLKNMRRHEKVFRTAQKLAKSRKANYIV